MRVVRCPGTLVRCKMKRLEVVHVYGPSEDFLSEATVASPPGST
jgi:hypothetical protein